MTSRLPLNEFSFTTLFEIERPPVLPANSPVANFRRISDGYFRTIRANMVDGRDFDSGDRSENLPVAIVNRKFAEYFLARSVCDWEKNKTVKRKRFLANHCWRSGRRQRTIIFAAGIASAIYSVFTRIARRSFIA